MQILARASIRGAVSSLPHPRHHSNPESATCGRKAEGYQHSPGMESRPDLQHQLTVAFKEFGLVPNSGRQSGEVKHTV